VKNEKVPLFLVMAIVSLMLVVSCSSVAQIPEEATEEVAAEEAETEEVAAEEAETEEAAAEEAETEEPRLIGFANLLRAGCDFCMDVENSVVEEFEAAGYEVYAVDNEFDLNKGLANADAMVTRQVDFFIEFNGNLDAYPAIVEKMQAADPPIPIAFIDGPAPEEEGVWYFGADSPGSGQIAGEWTLDWVKENWDGEIDGVISTWTSDWDENTLGRLTEFMNVIEGHNPDWNMDTISRIDVKLEAEKAQAAFSAYLNANPDAHHLIMYTPTNDVHALMALAAVEEAGREDDVLIVSLGADAQAQAEFRKPDNPFRMSVAYFPDRYGEFLVQMVTDILDGKEVPSAVYVEHVAITRDNVDEYYPAD
jgi:ribose transport system substrate-binding protein